MQVDGPRQPRSARLNPSGQHGSNCDANRRPHCSPNRDVPDRDPEGSARSDANGDANAQVSSALAFVLSFGARVRIHAAWTNGISMIYIDCSHRAPESINMDHP